MNKLISLFTLVFFLWLCLSSFAQVHTYTFSQSTESYGEITGDTTIAYATGTPGVMYNVIYPNNSLPFSFIFNGIGYTNVVISSNGFITFGGPLPGSTNYTPIQSSIAYQGVVSGYGNNLIGTRGVRGTGTSGSNVITGVLSAQFVGLEVGRVVGGHGIIPGTTITALNSGSGTITLSANASSSGLSDFTIATGSIVRGTSGVTGSRVHTIQFRNIRNVFFSSSNSNCINFQIKLYETSNIIEVVYGTNSASANVTGQVGLRGATNTDFNNRTTSTDWNSTLTGATNSATCSMTSSVLPSSGLHFRWTPADALTNDVGVKAITNPLSGGNTILSTPIAPKVIIKNFGIANQTSPFNITCTITPGGYSNTKSDTLSSGSTREIIFETTFTPVTGTIYTVSAYTTLASDSNTTNDSLNHTSTFVFQNYGNDSGYFYANNLATNQPSYPTFIWKDTSGSKNLVLNGFQSSGSSLIGSLDDGYFKLSLKNILLSLNMDTTNKHVKYNGVCFDSIFPGTNGIIGFTEKFGATSLLALQIDGNLVSRNALLPFWKDFILSAMGTGSSSNRLSYKITGSELIITYDRAASFTPRADWLSFQVIIEIVTGCGAPNSNFRYTYADTTTGQTSVSFVNNYLAGYDSILSSSTTFRNFVIGYSQNGGPIAYAGYISSGNPFPASPQTQLSAKRPAYNLDNKRGLAIEFGPDKNSLNKFDDMSGKINITMAIEGFYNSSTNCLNAKDFVKAYLANNVSPFNFVDSSVAILDSVTLTAHFEFYNAPSDTFYLVIRHRNSIETWSKLPQIYLSNGILNYDFTSAQTQAYGNNLILKETKHCIYNGDVNQSGAINLNDIIEVYNNASTFVNGYVTTDVTGDNITNLADILITYNNSAKFVVKITP